MKRISIFGLLAVLLLTCCQTREEKADALIKEALMPYLVKPDSYRPVETKLDSAFAPYDNPELLNTLGVLYGKLEERWDLKDKMQEKIRLMNVWGSGYTSEWSKKQYLGYKEEYDVFNGQYEKLNQKIQLQYAKVDSLVKVERQFIGFKATHNYRSDNNDGKTNIGNLFLVFDKDITEVRYIIDADQIGKLERALNAYSEEYVGK